MSSNSGCFSYYFLLDLLLLIIYKFIASLLYSKKLCKIAIFKVAKIQINKYIRKTGFIGKQFILLPGLFFSRNKFSALKEENTYLIITRKIKAIRDMKKIM